MVKNIFLTLFVLIFFVPVLSHGNSSLRCKDRLVFTGDTKFEVIKKCGEPDWTELRIEERIVRIYKNPYASGNEYRRPIIGKVPVEVEEWIYNLGPNRFIRILKFENGRLVDIETGDYGF